jgi:hypothetical protein
MVNRVTGAPTPGITAGRAKSAPTTAAGQFSLAAESPTTPIPDTTPTQSVSLAGMLALQEAETGSIQDKTARRHGFALLEALSTLQKHLLSPLADTETALASLTRLAADPPHTTDPALAALLDSIRLRAKIELLRRGVEPN